MPDGTIKAQRFDASGAERGAELQVNTSPGLLARNVAVASDAAGNFFVAWEKDGQVGSGEEIFGRRFGGIVPAALAVDTASTGGSDGNGVARARRVRRRPPVVAEREWSRR